MALVEMRDLVGHAYHNGYAVGAFDISSLTMLEAVIQAAENCRAPVIIQIAEPQMSHFDIELLAPAAEAAAHRATVPVVLHFDHGKSLQSVIRSIALGCNSVMIDASHSPLNDNIRITKEVVETAHGCGVAVEAELGYVPESEASKKSGELIFTTVEEARGFVKLTGVDLLAVSVGTTHGQLQGKPRLDYQRLRQINEALSLPLVIHGASGLTDDQYRRLVANGVAKINYFTALDELAAKQLAKNESKAQNGFLNLHQGVREVIAEEMERCMRIWGSAGRAAEVLAQCVTWEPVERTLFLRSEGEDPDDIALVLARGKRILSALPGVREVSSGVTHVAEGRDHYCWTIRFSHFDAIGRVERHPEFSSFYNRHLRGLLQEPLVFDSRFTEVLPDLRQPQPTVGALTKTLKKQCSRGGAVHAGLYYSRVVSVIGPPVT